MAKTWLIVNKSTEKMLLLGCFVLAFIAMAESLKSPHPQRCVVDHVLTKVWALRPEHQQRYCREFKIQRSMLKPHISTLMLASLEITRIKYDALEHIGVVSHLVLDNNGLIDTDYLAHVPLTTMKVSMRRNRIVNIVAGDFQRYQYFASLDLSQNAISRLNGNTIRNFDSLTKIDLSSNSIRSIQYRFFQGMKNIKVINLAGNPFITAIAVGSFCDLVQLDSIHWGNSIAIESISAKIFVNPAEYVKSNMQKKQFLESKVSSIPCNVNEILPVNLTPRKRNQQDLTRSDFCPKMRRMLHY